MATSERMGDGAPNESGRKVGHTRYMAWSRDYYESEARMFPHDHEIHGPFMAADEADLIAQLKAQGIDPETVRWEIYP